MVSGQEEGQEADAQTVVHPMPSSAGRRASGKGPVKAPGPPQSDDFVRRSGRLDKHARWRQRVAHASA